MKVALIGASGFVGTALLKELTDRGHTVTAIARHPEKISVKNSHVHPVAGDVMDAEQVAKIVKGHDAVISAYNSGWTNPKIYEDFMAGSRAIEAGVKKSGVKRFIVIGGAGSLEIKPGLQLIDSPNFPAEYKAGASGARDYLNEIKKDKELEWTYFSPAILMNHEHSGTRKGHYRTALNSPVFDDQGKSVLSVEDLALVIVDELEHPKHIRQRFTAAY
jgi:putative NADH-flavin reductase